MNLKRTRISTRITAGRTDKRQRKSESIRHGFSIHKSINPSDEDLPMLQKWFTGSNMIYRETIEGDKVYTLNRTGEVCLFKDDVLYVISNRYSLFKNLQPLKPLKDCDFYDYYGIHEVCPGKGKQRMLPHGPATLAYTDGDELSSSSSSSSCETYSMIQPGVDVDEFIQLICPMDGDS